METPWRERKYILWQGSKRTRRYSVFIESVKKEPKDWKKESGRQKRHAKKIPHDRR